MGKNASQAPEKNKPTSERHWSWFFRGFGIGFTAAALIAGIAITIILWQEPPSSTWVVVHDGSELTESEGGLSPAQGTLVLHVSVDNELSGEADEDDFDISELRTLVYEVRKVGEQLQINPQMPYLAELEMGGPVSGLDYVVSPFRWQPSILDLKIVNNTSRTVFFTEAVFEIERSVLDPWPVLVIDSGYTMGFNLVNEGWGEVIDCSLKFEVVPRSSTISFDHPFTYEESIGIFWEEYYIDLRDTLQTLGVDVQTIQEAGYDYSKERVHEALGPFKDGVALVYGEVDFSGRTTGGELETSILKFYSEVMLVRPHGGGGGGERVRPTYQYKAVFETSRDNYQVSVPLSQAIRATEADRFKIVIGALNSGLHVFDLKLVYNDNQTIVSPPIMLKIFLPRSRANLITTAQ